MSLGGYTGRVLRIDLTRKSASIEAIDPGILRQTIGGMGLALHYIERELKQPVSAFDPGNKVILATGPLTGTIAPTSSRFGVFTKSPSTGALLDSYCGGDFGKELKFAGYDMIIIEGQSPDLCYIEIIDNDVSFHDASHLRGRSVSQVNEALVKAHSKNASTVCVGPAGERRSPIAGLFSGTRSAGRGGAGAVMGAKNLKGIVVKGSRAANVAQPREFEQSVYEALRDLRNSNAVGLLKKYGTVTMLESVQSFESLPVGNYQQKSSADAWKLYADQWAGLWKRKVACFNCPISCGKVIDLPSSNGNKVEVDGPEYETIWSLGANCQLFDPEAITRASYLCDEYGIDTISAGNIIGFTMELYQRGLISAADLDGITPTWGSAEAVLQLTEKLCKGDGVGQLLELGVKRMADHVGAGHEFAMHVKGLEMPAFHPGGNYGIALAYATSPRGDCHLHGAPIAELLGGAEPGSVEDKVEMFLKQQAAGYVVNSLVLCYFVMQGINLKNVFFLLDHATGVDFAQPAELELIGLSIAARALRINRAFMIGDDQDWLPERTFEQGIDKNVFRQLLDEYRGALRRLTEAANARL